MERFYTMMKPFLNERGLRYFAAGASEILGYGGITEVARITGLAHSTIRRGKRELAAGTVCEAGRQRRKGGGRKKLVATDRTLLKDLEKLIEPMSRGDPMSPLRWTSKSLRTLTSALIKEGHEVSAYTVHGLLKKLGYSLQGSRKMEEGSQHVDRNAQFEYINDRVKEGMDAGNPVVSADTKKKELVGNYLNKGRNWHRKGGSPRVKDHDFPSPDVPRAYPYGIYDFAHNSGHVVIGTDHDTAQFATASIRGWWELHGKSQYPQATELLITADGGGSNGRRSRLWKRSLQELANGINLPVKVCHFPPGTSKWNKIEHRLFSFISTHWRGEPLIDYETIVRLISSTTTSKGLSVTCVLDHGKYKTGIKVTDEEMKSLRIEPDKFHGEWNYIIHPNKNKD